MKRPWSYSLIVPAIVLVLCIHPLRAQYQTGAAVPKAEDIKWHAYTTITNSRESVFDQILQMPISIPKQISRTVPANASSLWPSREMTTSLESDLVLFDETRKTPPDKTRLAFSRGWLERVPGVTPVPPPAGYILFGSPGIGPSGKLSISGHWGATLPEGEAYEFLKGAHAPSKTTYEEFRRRYATVTAWPMPSATPSQIQKFIEIAQRAIQNPTGHLNSYNLCTHNCLHSVKQAARDAGINLGNPGGFTEGHLFNVWLNQKVGPGFQPGHWGYNVAPTGSSIFDSVFTRRQTWQAPIGVKSYDSFGSTMQRWGFQSIQQRCTYNASLKTKLCN